MSERLIEKIDRLGAEAGIETMTPEIRRFALLVRQDTVAQWPDLTAQQRESYQKGHNDGVAHHKQAVKAAQPEQEPEVCCGDYATCMKPCTPRGRWLAEQEPVAYPEGDVVGPCVCGSWPGGKCLKCPRITTPPVQPEQEPWCVEMNGCKTKCADCPDKPKQEPVAWMRPSKDGYDSAFRDHSTVIRCTGNTWTGWVPLYTTPPAQREWVGLTDEQLEQRIGYRLPAYGFDAIRQLIKENT